MPYTVTSIQSGDADGNYALTLEDENGDRVDAVIPPKMEKDVSIAIQKTQALRESSLGAAFGGMLVLEVVRSTPGKGKNAPNERTLAIQTGELGWWALRMDRPVVEGMIADLESLLGGHSQMTH